tara:strand:+ start:56 stop:484 length:429 start_codon:yes stop_codon:yes gene_type:complete
MAPLTTEDMVFHRDSDGTITSAGFKINNIDLAQGNSPIVCIDKKSKKNDKVSDMLSDYAIPSGLFYMQELLEKNYKVENSNDVIDNQLFDKLLLLANDNKKEPNKEAKKEPKKEPKKEAKKETRKKNKKETRKKNKKETRKK